MAFLDWLAGQVLPLFSNSSSRRRFSHQYVQTVSLELLEPRLVLSALEITALVNEQAAGGQSQPLIEIDKPLLRTWEIRNTFPGHRRWWKRLSGDATCDFEVHLCQWTEGYGSRCEARTAVYYDRRWVRQTV